MTGNYVLETTQLHYNGARSHVSSTLKSSMRDLWSNFIDIIGSSIVNKKIVYFNFIRKYIILGIIKLFL